MQQRRIALLSMRHLYLYATSGIMTLVPGIHIRDLSSETLQALRRRARAHHRSVQGELRAILDEAARAAPPEEGYPPISLRQVEVGGERSWTRDDFYDDSPR